MHADAGLTLGLPVGFLIFPVTVLDKFSTGMLPEMEFRSDSGRICTISSFTLSRANTVQHAAITLNDPSLLSEWDALVGGRCEHGGKKGFDIPDRSRL